MAFPLVFRTLYPPARALYAFLFLAANTDIGALPDVLLTSVTDWLCGVVEIFCHLLVK